MSHHIIGLEPGATTEAEDDIESKATGDVRRIDLGSQGAALVGSFDDEDLEEIEALDHVRYVEEDGEVNALTVDPEPRNVRTDAQELPWGINRVDADQVDAGGEGVDIAIIDTGVDPTHQDLEPHVGEGIAIEECSTDDCNAPWDDDHSHGTHVAGTAAAVDNDLGVVGVAPDVTIHAVKVLTAAGSGTFSGVAAGIVAAAQEGWEVQNMSLGASTGSQVVKDALVEAANQGVTIVCSAGNSGPCTDCVGFPAAYEEAIAISATDDTDAMAGFSSTGPEVELAGPGVDVLSTLPGDRYGEFSGTSMSSPHVAGAAAVLAGQGLNRTEIRDVLTSTAEDIGHGDNEQGSGLLDVEAAAAGDPTEPPEEPTAFVELVIEQTEPDRGNIEAHVRDGNQDPVEAATVTIEGPTSDSKQTDAEGVAAFADVPIGQYSVTASKSGYSSATTNIDETDFE